MVNHNNMLAKIRILPVLLLIVFASMLVKIVDFTDYYGSVSDIVIDARLAALAQEEESENDPVWSEGAPSGPEEIKPSPENKTEKNILENLSSRRKELEEWSASIAMKENILNATENKINRKMEELRELKFQVAKLLDQYEQKEQKKIKRMVKIYENMKSKNAAEIFERMNMEILMEVISNMKESKAAPILAKLRPERAKEITERLILQRRIPVN